MEKGKEKKKKRDSQVILIGGEHHPAAGQVPRGLSTHAASQALSQPAGAAVLGKTSLSGDGGLHTFACKGRVGGELLLRPLAPAVWLHLRAVTWRKKLRVPVGKSL